jgi:hypothetical protein
MVKVGHRSPWRWAYAAIWAVLGLVVILLTQANFPGQLFIVATILTAPVGLLLLFLYVGGVIPLALIFGNHVAFVVSDIAFPVGFFIAGLVQWAIVARILAFRRRGRGAAR